MKATTMVLSLTLVLVACAGDGCRRNLAQSNSARKLSATGYSTQLKDAHRPPLLAYNQPPAASVLATQNFVLEGWVVDPVNKDCGSGIEVAVDGMAFATQDHILRPDVATYFHIPAYRESGFTWDVPARYLASGDHVFTIRLIDTSGDNYLESPPAHFAVR